MYGKKTDDAKMQPRTKRQAILTLAHLGGRVTARGARALLDVVRALTASSADGVRLVVALTERSGTFGLSECQRQH